jgi:sirohydrochlorin ferrochelatase
VREDALLAAEANLVAWEAREALRLWAAVQSQWRVGMGGATGLDYAAVYRVAETIGVDLDDTVLPLLQTLEAEQLDDWQERAERERDRAKAQKGGMRRG